MKNYCFFLFMSLITLLTTTVFERALACLSITDDLNYPNPTISAEFDLVPELNPFNDCWSGALRIRSRDNNWRLVANRIGPEPLTASGNSRDNVHANDMTIKLKLNNFGMASPDGAILIPPFDSKTELSSVQSGTFVVAGIKGSGNSCLPHVPSYYRVSNQLCLYRDFIYNIGSYQGELSYLLVAP